MRGLPVPNIDIARRQASGRAFETPADWEPGRNTSFEFSGSGSESMSHGGRDTDINRWR